MKSRRFNVPTWLAALLSPVRAAFLGGVFLGAVQLTERHAATLSADDVSPNSILANSTLETVPKQLPDLHGFRRFNRVPIGPRGSHGTRGALPTRLNKMRKLLRDSSLGDDVAEGSEEALLNSGKQLESGTVFRAPQARHSLDRIDLLKPLNVPDLIDAPGDENPGARTAAQQRLVHLSQTADRAGRNLLQQHLIGGILKAGLSSDLDIQLSIERLLEQIEDTNHRLDLETLRDGSSSENQTVDNSVLANQWQTFASRAGHDRDARHVFTALAVEAGPSWNWRELRRRDHGARHTLIGHLGCIAPTHAHFHCIESTLVYRQLDQFTWADRTMAHSHASVRVLGRLMDRTLRDNPYGWSIEQRLHLALMYHRDEVAIQICDLVIESQNRLPVDWTATLLALRQLECRRTLAESPHSETPHSSKWAQRFTEMQAALSDARLLSVKPCSIPGPPHSRLFDSEDFQTRVQDVAAWVVMDRNDSDARQWGMPQLQADPLWGARRSTIGFATQYERERELNRLKVSFCTTDF